MDGYVAATRFGLGARQEELTEINSDPRGWLRAQLQSPQMTHVAFSGLKNTEQRLTEIYRLRKQRKEAKLANDEEPVRVKQALKDMFISEMGARLQLAVTTATPFYERLVAFWSNHFSISVKKAFLLGLAGAYEREAIRPNVTGRFSDMLLAVAQHPAMLVYLDNAQSIGPQSRAGERSGKGLNENLAREILELHTLGVDGGYTQEDVTSFARVITGWGIGGVQSLKPGVFEFNPRRHEPGPKTVLGKRYDEGGQDEGITVLIDLAAHPATARHIAYKLAQHFIADEPPQAAVEKLAQVFTQSGGLLSDVYEALLQMQECWDVVHHVKVKNTYDLVVSAARVLNPGDADIITYGMHSLKFLGNIPFTADSPAGFADTVQGVMGPEALMRRIEWARTTGRKMALAAPAAELAGKTLGAMLGESTRQAIGNAENEGVAVAILLGSPEFQRR